MIFNTYRLMQVKSIAECSKESILQYFRPSLSHHLSLRPFLCLFLSGRYTQVLLYTRKHRIYVDTTSLRHIDVDTTLFESLGLLGKYSLY